LRGEDFVLEEPELPDILQKFFRHEGCVLV